jgi:hypothetical protein
VDGSAASLAVSTGLTPGGDQQKDPVSVVREQIAITLRTTWLRMITRLKQIKNAAIRGEIWRKAVKTLPFAKKYSPTRTKIAYTTL